MDSILSFFQGLTALLVAPLLFACGAASAPPPAQPQPTPTTQTVSEPSEVNAQGEERVAAQVGSAGGTLSLSDGARVRIPAGSLPEPTDVEFQIVADVPVFRYRPELRTLGPVFFVSPPLELQREDSFIEVSFPAGTLPTTVTPDKLALAVEQEIEERVSTVGARAFRWQYVPAVRDGDRVLARINVIPGTRMRFVVYR